MPTPGRPPGRPLSRVAQLTSLETIPCLLPLFSFLILPFLPVMTSIYRWLGGYYHFWLEYYRSSHGNGVLGKKCTRIMEVCHPWYELWDTGDWLLRRRCEGSDAGFFGEMGDGRKVCLQNLGLIVPDKNFANEI